MAREGASGLLPTIGHLGSVGLGESFPTVGRTPPNSLPFAVGGEFYFARPKLPTPFPATSDVAAKIGDQIRTPHVKTLLLAPASTPGLFPSDIAGFLPSPAVFQIPDTPGVETAIRQRIQNGLEETLPSPPAPNSGLVPSDLAGVFGSPAIFQIPGPSGVETMIRQRIQNGLAEIYPTILAPTSGTPPSTVAGAGPSAAAAAAGLIPAVYGWAGWVRPSQNVALPHADPSTPATTAQHLRSSWAFENGSTIPPLAQAEPSAVPVAAPAAAPPPTQVEPSAVAAAVPARAPHVTGPISYADAARAQSGAWTYSGPGCSSLGYGAMEELGPFRVHSDGKTLYPNIYSWHKAANVLFLESPAGVGFSYSNTSSDYDKLGDGFTASDNYKFLVNWLERFPEYKAREFYIAGESYAGHYVPQLAHEILLHNQKANRSIINLKGITIGNAVINYPTDDKGMYDFFGSHALISPQLARNIDNWCNFTAPVRSSDCTNALKQSDANTYDIDVDIYNIYGPICFSPNLTIHPKKTSLANFDPCSHIYVHAYLNRPEVQEAMHANVTKLNDEWQFCYNYSWVDYASTVLPLLKEFMANGLRVWVYNGDTDGRVPVTSTQYSLYEMELETMIEWYPWTHKKQIAGYTEIYTGGLTFATVRGAGHEVPSFQPDRALALISHFLSGKSLPKYKKSSDVHY